jgi:hemerythrin-like domain-containing protein
LEKYLSTPIKELITQFPELGSILEEFEIGCVPCNVGTCLFKDIMEIHNLAPQDEENLMTQIARVIYPDRRIAIPKIKRKKSPTQGQIQYSPPMKKLVEEHTLIKKIVGLIPKIIETLDLDSEEGRNRVQGTVDFIRFFADKYHHAKEEDILFKYFDENLDIIHTMYKDHEKARSHVRAISEGLKERNKQKVAEHLNAYKELLSEHIEKENEILYVWMDRNLSTKQVGKLFLSFSEADSTCDADVIKKCRNFVNTLEEEFQLNYKPAGLQEKEEKL